ncbi:MAG: inositol monophosphatase [Magnetococcales bacterium]|nr:inositol monophosphatase [Magnetococcales bacterium]MBF0261476.1 inositol monophosphatase [Magnetococcales bacterium]
MPHSPPMNIALRAAFKAGALAREWFDRRHELEVREKGKNDLVTSADLAVEEEIVFQLKKAYPKYGVLAEEKGGKLPTDRPCWIVDPIDGTLNFAHGLPHFAISIALLEEGKLVSGLVHDPMRDETFVAERGRGAYLNDRRIRVTDRRSLQGALLATGFPHRRLDRLPGYLKAFESFFPLVADQRRLGSAALDLAYVAAGRYDGFWEMGLAPWDIAAGALLVREAGGMVSDFANEENFLISGNVVAAHNAVHDEMLALIRQAGLA